VDRVQRKEKKGEEDRMVNNSIVRRKHLWSIALSPFITILKGTEINACS